MRTRRKPGEVRDAIRQYLTDKGGEASIDEIAAGVAKILQGDVARSSVRSYLNLNTDEEFTRTGRGRYILKNQQ